MVEVKLERLVRDPGPDGGDAHHFASVDSRTKLAERTRYVRRLRLEECCAEPLKPGGKLLMGDCPHRKVTDAHVTMLRDRRAETPEAVKTG